jgi:hypothetical protein
MQDEIANWCQGLSKIFLKLMIYFVLNDNK